MRYNKVPSLHGKGSIPLTNLSFSLPLKKFLIKMCNCYYDTDESHLVHLVSITIINFHNKPDTHLNLMIGQTTSLKYFLGVAGLEIMYYIFPLALPLYDTNVA